MSLNIHYEAIMRLIGLFMATFFMIRWTVKSNPAYDEMATVLVIIIAIAANYYGPLKMSL